MKCFRLIPVLLIAIVLFVTGCTQRNYYASPTPPPPGPSLLLDEAERNGFRAGLDDGARDAYGGSGYRPQHDRNFHQTPGYDPRLGPFGVYKSYFCEAYLHGYDKGFYRR